MNKEKQIEEMAKNIFEHCSAGLFEDEAKAIAHFVIERQGYRKASDVAREIFEEIENAHEECIHIDPTTNIGYLLQNKFEYKLAELKKKYTQEK